MIVAAQPVTSPWWIYADADGTYSASALNIVAGGHSRYFDHPGLPEQEALATTFGIVSLAHGGPTRSWANDEMLHLDRARAIFRGWAIFFFIGGAALAYLLCRRLFGHWTWGVAGGLLWLAMPGIQDTIEIRPDVLLSALMLLTGYVMVRAWERKSAALYAVAAGIAGFALMTKLHAVGDPARARAGHGARPPGARLVASARARRTRVRVPPPHLARAWHSSSGSCSSCSSTAAGSPSPCTTCTSRFWPRSCSSCSPMWSSRRSCTSEPARRRTASCSASSTPSSSCSWERSPSA